MERSRQEIGQDAEHQACIFLQAHGLRLIVQNYRCPFGEIDLIMQDKNDIVFIEVRSRKRSDYGNAFESINYRKRKKLIKTAIHFLQKKKWFDSRTGRFDAIAIHPINGTIQLEWIKNAFLIES